MQDYILKIEEVIGVPHINHGYTMDGYKIITTQNTYYVLICNWQNCCENWGYLTSEDDLNYYIGAELLEVDMTNKELKTIPEEKLDRYYREYACIQFVNFKTNIGTFQLAVYNEHNGYYGHDILVLKNNEILLKDIL